MYHVLFISYDGLTDPLGQSQIIPYLRGLCQYGYRFTIISCEKPGRFKNLEGQIRSLLSSLPIQWKPLPYHKWPPVISGVYDLMKIKQSARSIHLADRVDMIHTRSGTPALAGLWLKKKFGIKFLNDIRDFYAQSRVDSGQWPQNKFAYRQVFKYFSMMEKKELASSDGIVCLTHKAAGIIKKSTYYAQGTPLAVIPCSVDLSLFDPKKIDHSQREHLRKRFGWMSDEVVFTYLGSVGTWYLAAEMFSLFKKISEVHPKARLLVISPDDEKTIISIAEETNIPISKISITKASRNEVPILLSLSAYSIFFIKSCYSKQASSPTKLGEIMAMGIPVITNEGVGDVGEIVQKYNAGIILKNLDSIGFDDAMEKIASLQFEGTQIRNAAIDYFDLKKAIRSYHKIYSQILAGEDPVTQTNPMKPDNKAIDTSMIQINLPS